MNTLEIWNIVKFKQYSGYYAASSIGRIKRLKRTLPDGRVIQEKILSQDPTKDGYLRTTFRLNGKLVKPFVHKLVLGAFVDNPENKPEGNHKNGVKSDNRLSNLEWVTKSENILHSFRELGKKIKNPPKGKFGKHNHSSKKIICLNTGERYDSIRIAASELDLNEKSLALHCKGKFPSLYGLKFQYL